MSDKPDRSVINYLTKHTGGSIRHKNIRAVDCQQALFDLYYDWEQYHEDVLRKMIEDLELMINPQIIYDLNDQLKEIKRKYLGEFLVIQDD